MFSATCDILDVLQFQTIIQQKDQRIVALEGKLFTLKEQLAWLKKQIFGTKSERIVADLDIQPLLPDVDLSCPAPAQEPEKETISYDRNKRAKNRGSDTISFPDDLPVKRIELDIPEAAKFYEAMKSRVLANRVVFADETPIDLQVRGKSRCQQAYIWIYAGGGGGDPPYRFFEFCLNRNHEHPLTTLKDYKGFLHSDKYGAYEKLAKNKDITWCPCMAHVRRKFVEAEGGDQELRRHILRKIRHLFLLDVPF